MSIFKMINVIDLLDGDLRAWHYKVPKIKIPIIIKNDIKIIKIKIDENIALDNSDYTHLYTYEMDIAGITGVVEQKHLSLNITEMYRKTVYLIYLLLSSQQITTQESEKLQTYFEDNILKCDANLKDMVNDVNLIARTHGLY